jgi:predicted cupin superfamily sugar epimerase
MRTAGLHPRAAALITELGLAPHPEGGFYRETFRSPVQVTPADGRGARAALTHIHFLLPGGAASRWHRVTSDEIWHLFEGGPLELLEMDDACHAFTTRQLGDDPAQRTHAVIAGHWQAARALGDYALVGCTVAPGFDFADFTMLADELSLANGVRDRWPALAELI